MLSTENPFTEKTITDTWGFYDIQDRIRDIMDNDDYIIDLSVGNSVLELMERNYDAAIGYNWDQVDYWYDFVMNGEH